MDSRIDCESVRDSSYSWERRPEKTFSRLWPNHSSNSMSDSNSDELFVFGYSCKLFRDDERALHMDCGKHLIPWMGTESLLIDRFDVRGYLNDLKLYEPNRNASQELTPEELEIERLCDEERFADLNNHEDNNHEEEIKRFHAALADVADYHQMDYKYDENTINATEIVMQSLCEKEENEEIEDSDRFKLPSGLSPPQGVSLPDSQKLHNIIEKTASFVSKHGTQMEIIVKTKQSSNKNFDFMSFDSKLNPYYRYLLSNIKSGKYIPKQTEDSDKSDSDSDDEHYLHPSLLGSKSRDNPNEPFNIPNLLRSTNNHDSYSQLVKSFKDKFPTNYEEILETTKPLSEAKLSVESDSQENDGNNGNKSYGTIASQPMWSSLLPSPPPEIELIIEKLAQHVAKNGEQFELSIRKLGETRFEFVNPGNIYHAYYIRRKLHHLEENRKAQAAQLKMTHKKTANRSDSHALKAPVSFSISAKDSKSNAQIALSDDSLLTGLSKRDDERNSEVNAKRICENALKDKLAYAARDRVAKEKQLQEERKRKAAVFLSLIKKQTKEQPKTLNSNETTRQNSSTYGPELPKSKTCDNQQLSPTIAAITSPNNSPDNKNGDNENLLLDTVLSHKSYETAKSGSLLPFIVSDKPLKESSSRLSPPHRHHRYKRSSSHQKSYKRKRSRSPKTKSRNSSKSRSPRSSRSPSHSHKKHSKESSKSRSRSRSGSHTRSHKRH